MTEEKELNFVSNAQVVFDEKTETMVVEVTMGEEIGSLRSVDEMISEYITAVSVKSAHCGDLEHQFGKQQKREATRLIAALYGSQSTVPSDNSDYDLLLSTVTGFMHAAGRSVQMGYGNTATYSKVIEHMGSNFRPSKHADFYFMLKAAFNVVEYFRKTSTGKLIEVERYRLKTDLSDVFKQFRENRKDAGLKIKAYNLFEGLE